MSERAEPLTTAADGALLPRPVRRTAYAVVLALLAFGIYLFVVRGPAMMLDFAAAAYNMFCQ
jgi:hypothetical protein